ncbi:MAG: hypothetical protein EOP56_10005 [Sphingobacteriales bacterium]|nr:MAG: hypothetical protein EOP56_10005 [Sphingobacteriales bacterium]
MSVRYINLVILLFLAHTGTAQQFVGLTTNTYSAVQQIPYNPAWVNNAANGTELGLFAVSILAGNNGYNFSKDGGELRKDRTENKKHLWQNVDVLGPSISFTVKQKHNFGIYTRMRELARMGNIPFKIFNVIGIEDISKIPFMTDLDLDKSGVSIHTFGEVGVSYGKVLRNDEYHILKGGATVKYIMAFGAASVYLDDFSLVLQTEDTIASIRGTINTQYAHNVNSYFTAPGVYPFTVMDRAGKGGLGLDLGMQYEYHPDGTPNYETPYKYSIAVSLTDIGSALYYADSGSGAYNLVGTTRNLNAIERRKQEDIGQYLNRAVADSILIRKNAVQKFRMGLPTALRINTDWVANNNFNIAINTVLNLKGNGGDIYRPAYVNYLNVTPSYGNRRYSVSMPCTFYGKQTLTLGAAFRYGPFYIGSSSLISNILPKTIKNADFYMGLMLKFKKDKFII